MSVTEHEVHRRTANLTAVAQPADFVLRPGRPAAPERLLDPDVSPYCFDFDAGTLLCVSAPDVRDATFLYQAQRQRARRVLVAPFAALPEAPPSPTLIFSIGRCGSTLLQKAFAAAGVGSVSEPDYFRQAVLQRPHDDAVRDAVGRATALLGCPVVKLHAECANAPLVVAGAFRAPRVMFVLRDAVDWADSVRRVTRDADPARAAALLRALLSGLDPLTRAYDVRIVYYEDFRELTARYVNALLAWMASEARLRPAQATELAARDAQEGSIAARDAVRSAGPDPAYRAAFHYEWSRARPAALIARLGLARL
jgi:hypothetical protein